MKLKLNYSDSGLDRDGTANFLKLLHINIPVLLTGTNTDGVQNYITV